MRLEFPLELNWQTKCKSQLEITIKRQEKNDRVHETEGEHYMPPAVSDLQ